MHISKTEYRLQSLPALFFDNSVVETVIQFKYLGPLVNNYNNHTPTRLANVPTASATSAVILRGLTQNFPHAPVDRGVELFGTFVKPAACTGHVMSVGGSHPKPIS